MTMVPLGIAFTPAKIQSNCIWQIDVLLTVDQYIKTTVLISPKSMVRSDKLGSYERLHSIRLNETKFAHVSMRSTLMTFPLDRQIASFCGIKSINVTTRGLFYTFSLHASMFCAC